MRTNIPKATILENGAQVTIYAELPGVKKDDLDIKVDAEMLTINGVTSFPIPENSKALHKEFFATEDYKRQFILSNKIDKNSINANLENGILKITLAKLKEEQAKKIPVK